MTADGVRNADLSSYMVSNINFQVVRLLNQRQNTSAALQYIEEAHDKWNRKQESCHRANLTPFGIKLTLERDQAGHIVNSKLVRTTTIITNHQYIVHF